MQINIKELKKKILPILDRHGIKKAGLFGSYVRGEINKDSDIDILIELPKEKSLFNLVELEMELSEKIGRKVDLLTEKSISPYLIDRIKKELKVISK